MSAAIKEAVDEVLTEAADSADDEKQEAARRLIGAFMSWEKIREYATQERSRTKENVAARLAQFKEAMEVGHSSESDQLLKLTVCEQRWQELDDARAERRDVNHAMRDQTKAAEQKIKDLITEMKGSPQLTLFDTTPTIDNPPTPEDDDEDEDIG